MHVKEIRLMSFNVKPTRSQIGNFVASERIRVAVMSDVAPQNKQQQLIEGVIALFVVTLLVTFSLSLS
jgi:hypothetical protein